jgi:hypothetical protein
MVLAGSMSQDLLAIQLLHESSIYMPHMQSDVTLSDIYVYDPVYISFGQKPSGPRYILCEWMRM